MVLAKASGNPAWLDDARARQADPMTALRSLAYLDRMSDQPKHDEQGSRDRPYDLVAAFDPAAIDAALRGWGDAPWDGPRPVLAVAVTIRTRRGDTIAMHADTDSDERHRAALLAAADRFGVALAIPAVLLPVPPPAGSPVLVGHMVWSDAEFGWVGEWTLDWGGAVHRWGERGVGFDAAYRDAIAGAVRVLSGHR